MDSLADRVLHIVLSCDYSQLTILDLRVYVARVQNVDATRKDIATALGIHERQVGRAEQRLKIAGFLDFRRERVRPGDKKSRNIYQIPDFDSVVSNDQMINVVHLFPMNHEHDMSHNKKLELLSFLDPAGRRAAAKVATLAECEKARRLWDSRNFPDHWRAPAAVIQKYLANGDGDNLPDPDQEQLPAGTLPSPDEERPAGEALPLDVVKLEFKQVLVNNPDLQDDVERIAKELGLYKATTEEEARQITLAAFAEYTQQE